MANATSHLHPGGVREGVEGGAGPPPKGLPCGPKWRGA